MRNQWQFGAQCSLKQGRHFLRKNNTLILEYSVVSLEYLMTFSGPVFSLISPACYPNEI